MDCTSLTPNHSTKDRAWGVAIVLALFIAISWSVILSGNLSGRGASDDLRFHWLVIEQFAQQLPNPDISDYASATTPGYHLILSPLVEMGIGHTGVQLFASLWTAGLLGLMAWVVSARFGIASAVLVLPMIASMYVLFPGIWLLPDNAGWLGVLAILLLALRPNPGWKNWVLSGLILLVLVWMRQIHIWIAGVVWVSAWVGSIEQAPCLTKLFSSVIDRSGRTCIAIACTIPAFTALIWFLLLWGGLVPPTFQDKHQGANLATPGFILMQLAILSVFFSPMLWPGLKEVWKHHWRWVILAAAVGCVLGMVPESSYSESAGRYSGWWNLINKLPVVADRSPIFVLGSIAGAVVLVVWMSLASRRDVWIWMGLMVAFVLAQSANHASWQRYHEPMLLMMMVLIIARSSVIAQYTRRIMLGALVLALVLGVLTAGLMLNASSVVETRIQHQYEP